MVTAQARTSAARTEPPFQRRIRNIASSSKGRMRHSSQCGFESRRSATGPAAICETAALPARTVFLFHASPLPAGRGLFSSRPGDAYPRA